MRHPVIARGGCRSPLLLIAAMPYLNINTGAAGLATLPDSTHAKQGYVVLNRDFTVGEVTPATIVVDGDVRSGRRAQALREAAGRAGEGRPLRNAAADGRPAQNLAVITVPVAGDPNSDAALDAVRDAARRIPSRRARRHRAQRLRHRRQRAEPRLLRHHRQVPADRVRAGARPELHPAHARLPLDRRAGVEHRHEPALRRRRLRAARARDPGRPRRRTVRLPAGADRRGLDPAVPVLRALRAVDGLPGVPALADPRALRRDEATSARPSPTASPRPPG